MASRAGLLVVGCLLLAAAVHAQDATCEAGLAACKKETESCLSKYRGIYDQWKEKADEVNSLQATVKELKAQLKKSKGAEDWPSLVTALVTLSKNSVVSAGQEANAILVDLQQGKTGRLMAVVGSWVATFKGAASCTTTFVLTQADRYLPDSVKKQISAAWGVVLAEWEEHVTKAAWAQPVLKAVRGVVDEVTALVKKTLSSSPALAPLADPVTVQLVVYAVFALPVVLLLVLPLALCLGRRSGASKAGAPRSGARKAKKSGGKRA